MAMVVSNDPSVGVPTPELAERVRRVRQRTEELVAPLSVEDQVVQSMPDTSPTKWHRAHTTWFFAEFVLGADGTSGRSWDRPEYRFCFNSYYDAVGARHARPDRGLLTRPSNDEVTAYRRAVDDELDALMAVDELDPVLAATIMLGTHHEEQHQELLLIDAKHVLSRNPAMAPAYANVDVEPAPDPGPLGFVPFGGGLVEIGLDVDAVVAAGGFAFDNEGPVHEVRIYDGAIGDRLVTAGEWCAFIDDGGYARPELWKSDGWHRSIAEGWNAPEYWRVDPDRPGEWLVHTLTGTRPIDPHEPVCHVSHYEADAYATWAGARLPTEFEWEYVTRSQLGSSVSPAMSDRWHPGSAGPADGSVRQLLGGCWEWTSSAYQPYPGFSIAEGAIGEYNGKFMSGQQVLRGGGALTPAGHARPTYRNFFHPHTRWHLGGVRLAANA